MPLYPNAIQKGPIPASNYATGGTPKIGVVNHVIVGTAQSAINTFLSANSQVSAHFVVDFDGKIYQMLDTNNCCYAQGKGNYPPTSYIAIEYAGDPTTAMTQNQILSGAAITAWASSTHWFPITGVVAHGQPGVTAHCNPNGTPDPGWGNHSCPGSIRLAQIPQIIYLAYLTQHPTPVTPVVSTTKESINMAAEVPTGGQLVVRPDGGVFAFGGAGFYGSLPGLNIKVSNVIGIAPTLTGKGYWLAGADGAVYSFGDAGYHGSGTGNPGWGIGTTTNPVVGIITDNTKKNGYILVADTGTGNPALYACNEVQNYK